VAGRIKQGSKSKMPIAESIASDDLLPGIEEEIFIDLEEIKRGFVASGHHLYNYIMQYQYEREVSYEEKITIFCQMISMYEQELNVKDIFQHDETVEYAMVYPNPHPLKG
ncbi:MAG: hypothetical protein ABIS69_09665, partial [Sediminibacterium sp.]